MKTYSEPFQLNDTLYSRWKLEWSNLCVSYTVWAYLPVILIGFCARLEPIAAQGKCWCIYSQMVEPRRVKQNRIMPFNTCWRKWTLSAEWCTYIRWKLECSKLYTVSCLPVVLVGRSYARVNIPSVTQGKMLIYIRKWSSHVGLNKIEYAFYNMKTRRVMNPFSWYTTLTSDGSKI